MNFFISDAIAATPPAQAAAAHPDGGFSFIMIAGIFVLFYFMLIRPQNKRAKEQREMITKLKKGDEIITSGGIVAKIVSVEEQFIKVSPAEGIEMTLQRNAVSAILPKGTLKSL